MHTRQDCIDVNLVDLARMVVSRNQPKTEERSIVKKENFVEQPIYAKVDPDQISKVFDVLLSNSLQFGSEGGEVLMNVLRNAEGGSQVTAQDTGPGFNISAPEDAFLPFIISEDNNSNRVGIGLTLAKEIVTTHGGKIWIDTEFKDGTLVHFTLPLQKNAE